MVGSQLSSRVIYWRLGPRWHLTFRAARRSGLDRPARADGRRHQPMVGATDPVLCRHLDGPGVRPRSGCVFRDDDTGRASTLYNASRQLGGAIGVALFTTTIVIEQGGGPDRRTAARRRGPPRSQPHRLPDHIPRSRGHRSHRRRRRAVHQRRRCSTNDGQSTTSQRPPTRRTSHGARRVTGPAPTKPPESRSTPAIQAGPWVDDHPKRGRSPPPTEMHSSPERGWRSVVQNAGLCLCSRAWRLPAGRCQRSAGSGRGRRRCLDSARAPSTCADAQASLARPRPELAVAVA
jgi:hypothetical protein